MQRIPTTVKRDLYPWSQKLPRTPSSTSARVSRRGASTASRSRPGSVRAGSASRSTASAASMCPSRQPIGATRSDRRERLYAQRHRRYAKVSHLRNDHHHKIATAIAKRGGTVKVETLNFAGMSRNGWLGRTLSDAGMGKVVRMLAYKCAWYGTACQRLDRWYPSSKTCSHCRAVKQSLLLSERTYRCVTCSCAGGRNENAVRRAPGRPSRSSPTWRPVRRAGHPERTVSEASTRQAVRFRCTSEVEIAIGSEDRCSASTTNQSPTGIWQPLATAAVKARLPSTTPAAAYPLVDPDFLPCVRAGTDSAVFLPNRGPRGQRHDHEWSVTLIQYQFHEEHVIRPVPFVGARLVY